MKLIPFKLDDNCYVACRIWLDGTLSILDNKFYPTPEDTQKDIDKCTSILKS